MRNRAQRQQEERSLLYQVFTEGLTDNEKLKGFRMAQMVEKGLELMKVNSLLGLSGKKPGKRVFHELLEQMLGEEIRAWYELGLNELTKINLTDIQSAMWAFQFTYIKVKEGKKIKHRNQTTVLAQDESSARSELLRRLKKINDVLVEEISVTKRLDSIMTDNGFFHAYEIEIVTEPS